MGGPGGLQRERGRMARRSDSIVSMGSVRIVVRDLVRVCVRMASEKCVDSCTCVLLSFFLGLC